MLKKWSEIRAHFNDTLIIGNGSSVAIDGRFNYKSLYEAASLSTEAKDVFKGLKTEDFELVLRTLSGAASVNKALRIYDRKTEKEYEAIQQALIATVLKVHPEYNEVESRLGAVENFTRRFKRIFTLNYDLLFYWAFMLRNREHKNHYKDFFVSGKFAYDNIEELKKPTSGNPNVIEVYYPHGNLALYTDLIVEEKVIIGDAKKSDLLRGIINTWEKGTTKTLPSPVRISDLPTAQRRPLFVSEGETDKKLSSILRSRYLTHVYFNELRAPAESVCIYGWSIGDHDQHLWDSLAWSNAKRFAISSYNSRTDKAEEWRDGIEKKFKRSKLKGDLVFFDSSDAGAWNN